MFMYLSFVCNNKHIDCDKHITHGDVRCALQCDGVDEQSNHIIKSKFSTFENIVGVEYNNFSPFLPH